MLKQITLEFPRKVDLNIFDHSADTVCSLYIDSSIIHMHAHSWKFHTTEVRTSEMVITVKTFCPCFTLIYCYILLSSTPQFSSVQSLSHIWLFATPWIAARQSSLSITNSWSLLKLMPIESVMPSSHLILCRLLLLLPPSPPSIRVFSNESTLCIGGQSTRVSASALVLPMNTQHWSPLGLTGWISLQSKGLSRVFSNTIVQKHQFLGAQLSSQSNSHIHTWLLEKP